uniref:Histone deacetylase n=1 Tax=Timema monikensis TaxID=170555 RepID=A0A7R9HUW5_9NEOP|nr:unnamed protein product [Timema monikensis]
MLEVAAGATLAKSPLKWLAILQLAVLCCLEGQTSTTATILWNLGYTSKPSSSRYCRPHLETSAQLFCAPISVYLSRGPPEYLRHVDNVIVYNWPHTNMAADFFNRVLDPPPLPPLPARLLVSLNYGYTEPTLSARVSSPGDVTTELFIAAERHVGLSLYFQVKGSSAGVEGHKLNPTLLITPHIFKKILKKQQQLQQQILLQHFQAQQQQLAEQHEQQLRQHLKEFWEHQKQLEEQRERREKERLEALKKKDKHEQSAVASTEVKQKLQVHKI